MVFDLNIYIAHYYGRLGLSKSYTTPSEKDGIDLCCTRRHH